MNKTLKRRLAIFVFAIVSAVMLILWAAHDSWQQAENVRDRLTTVQLESFRIADRFQQTIQQLNNLLLRFAINRQPADRDQFDRQRKDLDNWIDHQRNRPKLSAQEQTRLHDIDVAYDFYMAAGSNIATRVSSTGLSPSLADFSDFETQSERLLNLGFQLAEAHRESLDSFLGKTNTSLERLQIVLLVALLCLLLLFSGLAVMTYRGMIAPLQLKLVETQALMDRHEKLASLGMLAAGVAHEIRNPLTAIKARLFTLQRRLTRDTPSFADSDVIAQEINRLERIVKEVLQFARPSDPQLVMTSAPKLLHEVAALMQPTLEKAGIQLLVEESADAEVQADPQQMKQVLINLIQNAADSIAGAGSITLRARTQNKRRAGEKTGVVILEVADTGRGIPPEAQKRLFDPFFSTKESGTGLGLPIASRIVEKHGGALQYQTEVNRGTTFGIVLPRA